MPIGEIIVEVVAQGVGEIGGDAIKRRYGWKGCLIAVVITVGALALAVWAFS